MYTYMFLRRGFAVYRRSICARDMDAALAAGSFPTTDAGPHPGIEDKSPKP